MLFGIYDTNLIKFLTRSGKRHRYDHAITFLHKNSLIDFDSSLIIITVGGALEFLGNLAPNFSLEQKYKNEMFDRLQRMSNPEVQINDERFRALKKLETIIRSSNQYSKSKLSKSIGHEITFVDDSLKSFIGGLLKDNLLSSTGRSFLINRIALDCLQRMIWPPNLKELVHSAYIMDIYQGTKEKIGYNFPRSMSFVSESFFRKIDFALFQGKIPPNELKSDIQTLQQRFSFGSTGDFLDTEALHYVVVGRFNEHFLNKVLFCTHDPFESCVSRILIYRWLYHAGYKILKGDKAIPDQAAGVVVIFSKDLRTANIVDVGKLPTDLDFLKDQRLDAWVQAIKKQTLIEIDSSYVDH